MIFFLKKFILLFFTALFFSGCSAVPFRETQDVLMESADTTAVLESFKTRSPNILHLINTVTFQYKWNKFSSIGYMLINTTERNFKVVCINPIGIKLFEISGDSEKDVVSHFVMAELENKGNIATFVGKDIRRIYFDMFPSIAATIEKKRFKIIFNEKSGNGIMEYVFAGADGNIVEKKYYENNMPVWSASYYEYRQYQEKIYPTGIIFKNYKYGYTLTVKLKEIVS